MTNVLSYNSEALEIVSTSASKELAPVAETRKAARENLLLANEKIEYATQEKVESVMEKLDSLLDPIQVKQIEYSTRLHQGQLTGGFRRVLIRNFEDLFKLVNTDKPVPKLMIDTIEGGPETKEAQLSIAA